MTTGYYVERSDGESENFETMEEAKAWASQGSRIYRFDEADNTLEEVGDDE